MCHRGCPSSCWIKEVMFNLNKFQFIWISASWVIRCVIAGEESKYFKTASNAVFEHFKTWQGTIINATIYRGYHVTRISAINSSTLLIPHLFTKSTQMECLRLDNNKFGDEGAKELAAVLAKIKELRIGDCGITEAGINMLRERRAQLPDPVRCFIWSTLEMLNIINLVTL